MCKFQIIGIDTAEACPLALHAVAAIPRYIDGVGTVVGCANGRAPHAAVLDIDVLHVGLQLRRVKSLGLGMSGC